MKAIFSTLLLFVLGCVPMHAQLDSIRLLTDVEVLSSDAYGGRRMGTEGHKMAQAYIVNRFKKLGIQSYADNYRHRFKYADRLLGKDSPGVNIVGYLKGKTSPEKYIVVGAHYDHLGTRGEKIFNGADDNASGVATLLAVAEYFSENQPEHSMIFCSWDAEEAGLFGSYAFVHSPPVDRKSIEFYWNIDMMARNANEELYVMGTHYWPHFKAALQPIYDASGMKVLFGHDDPKKNEEQEDWTESSDQGAFHKKGIPWLYYSVEDHEDYHKETDEFSRIMPSFYFKAALLVANSLIYVDGNLKTFLKP
jgi:Zn-dependent M28 family amino/carboxypeptidase